MILSTIGLFKQRRLLALFLDDIPTTKTILFWGKKHPNRRKLAKISNLSLLNLEDGFLRSPGLGVAGCPPYSIVYDDIGIYYDTTRPSRLEQLILAAAACPNITTPQNFQTAILYAPHPNPKPSSSSTKRSAIWRYDTAARTQPHSNTCFRRP